MDASQNGLRNFRLDGGVDSNIFLNMESSVSIQNSIDTRITLGDSMSSLNVSNGEGIRILGGDARDAIRVSASSDVYISTGGGALPEPFTPQNETGVYGCDDFRIVGGDEVDFINIDSHAEYIDGEQVGTTTSSNGVAYGGGGDDTIHLLHGEDVRVLGGEGSDDIFVEEGEYNLFGGAEADYFSFSIDAGDYDVRIKDFDLSEDAIAFNYHLSDEYVTAQQAYDLFMENAFERGANVITSVDGNQIVLHDTTLDVLSIDNFNDTIVPGGVDQ